MMQYLNYGDLVKELIPDITTTDFNFLCKQMLLLYESIDDDCVDSDRASRAVNGEWSDKYQDLITCCGQIDKEVKNPLSGNSFFIGFNYGH